ncbi:putative serine hydrolase [Oratosquilla oratoria]|uniref:putative serine hydrolase n=1 Tax=Oratosquilla oratoria TaxID=337810 RepID=UPI003F75CA68
MQTVVRSQLGRLNWYFSVCGHKPILRSMSSSPKEISIPVLQGSIAGKVWNEDGQIPILALHGWLDNAGTWDRIAPLLPKNFKLVAIDFLGHGFSSPPPIGSGGYFTENVVAVERIVRHFGWEKINLLGHSMGGGVAMFYAGIYPEKVNKFVMIDLIKPLSIKPERQPERVAQAIDELLAAEKRFKSQPPQYDYDTLVQRLITSYGQTITEKDAKTLLIRGAKQWENGKYSFNFDPRLKASSILSTTFEQQKSFASHIRCDMLVIKATNGPLYEQRELYEDILQVYEKSAKTFKYRTVEGNHHVHLSKPETVAPLLIDFFKDQSMEDDDSSNLCSKLKNSL